MQSNAGATAWQRKLYLTTNLTAMEVAKGNGNGGQRDLRLRKAGQSDSYLLAAQTLSAPPLLLSSVTECSADSAHV